MKTFHQLIEGLVESTAGATGKDQHYAGDHDYSDHSPHKERHLQSASQHIIKHEDAGKYKVNHDHPNSPHPKHKNPDITLHYTPDAEGDYDHYAYTVHHKGAAAHDKNLHKRVLHAPGGHNS